MALSSNHRDGLKLVGVINASMDDAMVNLVLYFTFTSLKADGFASIDGSLNTRSV